MSLIKKLYRRFAKNPLDALLEKQANDSKTSHHILLFWNRGLGDIALGLYAITLRIKKYLPDAKITFLIRKDLEEGFKLFKEANYIVAPAWERSKHHDTKETLLDLNIDPNSYSLIIEKPDPTYWVSWQYGKIVPKLYFDEKKYDNLYEKYNLPDEYTYIGVQPSAETSYGLWRNLSNDKWKEIFKHFINAKQATLEYSKVKFILLGNFSNNNFTDENIIDLRGKTNLFELLSIIKNKCKMLILPDSGILSMVYYLNTNFKIDVISLWAFKEHGILKQNVKSPNTLLNHFPIISKENDLSKLDTSQLISLIEKRINEKLKKL
jgi:ADP-heptose:LPS heptosyltransferase